MECGYSVCIWALTFHHIDPSTKEFAIGQAHTRAWPRVKKELDKCVLLCNRCHTEIHHGVTDLKSSLKKNPTPQEGDLLLEKAVAEGRIQPYSVKAPKKVHFCEDCGEPICNKKASKCRKCYHLSRTGTQLTKIAWPSLEVLLEKVESQGYSATGRELGVSDNAIRKRIQTRQRARSELNRGPVD